MMPERTTTRTVLQTHDLTIGYRPNRRDSITVAAGLDLSLRAGELVCLLGPNGAGKSTLMRTLAGMQPPLNGRITLAGRDLTELNRRELARLLSIVLTERVDVGTLTAYALVALGRYPYTDWSGMLTAEDEAIVQQSMQAVGAAPLAGRSVSELSDGERQKVMIARALAQEPDLILLDEPTAFLDLPRRVEIMQVLRHLTRREDRAILLSTHDLDLALRSADRLWLLPGDGPMQIGAPEDLILSGAFEATFKSEGVTFDPATGSFRLNARRQRHIAIESAAGADPIAIYWTRRAIQRAGYVPVDTPTNDDDPLVMIESGPRWRLILSDTDSSEADSVDALIKTLVDALTAAR